jgi:hypothetical protein
MHECDLSLEPVNEICSVRNQIIILPLTVRQNGINYASLAVGTNGRNSNCLPLRFSIVYRPFCFKNHTKLSLLFLIKFWHFLIRLLQLFTKGVNNSGQLKD